MLHLIFARFASACGSIRVRAFFAGFAFVCFLLSSVSIGTMQSKSADASVSLEPLSILTVTNLLNSGAGSLRDTVAAAAPGDTINFSVTGTVPLSGGQITIDKNLIITGPGANLLTVQNTAAAGATSRVFLVNSGVTATISGLTISGGNLINSGEHGGGIFNFGTLTVTNSTISNNLITGTAGGGGIASAPFSTLTVTDSTISGNTANIGGGILSVGTVNIARSTISGNNATIDGGGLNLQNANGSLTNSTISGNTAGSSGSGVVFVSFGGSFTLQVTNCTIANNNAPNNGGILTVGQGATASATTMLRNSIIANNTAPNLFARGSGGGTGTITSQGFNLTNDPTNVILNQPTDQFNTNPLLGTLSNNGGPTQTRALLPLSPAIDKGSVANDPVTMTPIITDQRGFTRPVDDVSIPNAPMGNGSDIGAFESIGKSRADFDGDGKTDLSVYRPSEGNWYLNRSTTGFSVLNWGISTDTLVPGDFDGDGKADTAIFRPDANSANPDFYVLNSNGFTLSGASWGVPNDIPVSGDYNGDGKTDIAVFRPSSGVWYILNSTTGTNTIEPFGLTGDVPLAIDNNGDGKTNLAVFRPSNNTWYIAKPTGVPATNFDAYPFGLAGDLPVQADYDGDNKEDVAMFRPSNGVWYILRSSNGATELRPFGAMGDVPVPGDYDGDGKDDVAVYRGGTWYVNRSTAGLLIQNFGIGTDKAIPKAYIP